MLRLQEHTGVHRFPHRTVRTAAEGAHAPSRLHAQLPLLGRSLRGIQCGDASQQASGDHEHGRGGQRTVHDGSQRRRIPRRDTPRPAQTPRHGVLQYCARRPQLLPRVPRCAGEGALGVVQEDQIRSPAQIPVGLLQRLPQAGGIERVLCGAVVAREEADLRGEGTPVQETAAESRQGGMGSEIPVVEAGVDPGDA